MMKRQTTPTPPANLSGIDWDQMPEVDPAQVDQDLALMQALPSSAGEPMDPMFDSAEQEQEITAEYFAQRKRAKG